MPRNESPAAAGDAQKQVDEEQDKGYLGNKVDPLPNSAYSLESGPDSPTVAHGEPVTQPSAQQKEG